ncbi:MAG: glycoside hydrolase family 28 protein, partial [Bacteroidales bacterium]|nr:glycoside hydrolase family 28 protein [Bacteroidales bacterium]
MKKLTTVFLFFLICAGFVLNGQTVTPARVVIPDRQVSLTDFGGVSDGVTSNTEAFRKAIAALDKQGGGT